MTTRKRWRWKKTWNSDHSGFWYEAKTPYGELFAEEGYGHNEHKWVAGWWPISSTCSEPVGLGRDWPSADAAKTSAESYLSMLEEIARR